jgi:hypothetical protein
MEELVYNNLLTYLNTNEYPNNFNQIQQNKLKTQSKHYHVQHDLLYKKNRNNTDNLIRVLRKFEVGPALYMFHNDPTAAHTSKEKMMEKLKKRFYWPQMFEDIRKYTQSCDECQRRGRTSRIEPLHPIPIGQPFHRIGIDYVGPLPPSSKGNKYIIVAMDYLTKWPEAKPVRNADAKSTVKFIYEDIICRHGCPGEILTDRGTHFNNQLLHELLQKFEVPHRMSTPYHPQTNGLVERFNRTLIEALAKTTTSHIKNWDQYIAPILFAYRTNEHSVTKMSPFFLVYGRDAKLPMDSTKMEEESILLNHVEKQLDHLPIVRNTVRQQLQIEQQKQKDRHDKKLKRLILYHIGDKVLYFEAAKDKTHTGKLDPKWKGPYYIHDIIGNGAYKIRQLDGRLLKAPVNRSLLQKYINRDD